MPTVHAIFAEAAFLAGRAMEAATDLQRMPGMSAEAFAEALDFWRRVRDHVRTAALDSLGGNSTLAEALVTFRLLHSPEERNQVREEYGLNFCNQGITGSRQKRVPNPSAKVHN